MTFDGICRHTALAALAQLRNIAIRNALNGDITLPPAPARAREDAAPGPVTSDDADCDVSDADLVIPLGDAPVPARGGQPCPRNRTGQAVRRRDHPAGGPCQPLRRRAHQPGPARLRPALVRPPPAAPGRRPLAPLQQPPPGRHHLTPAGRKEVTPCNQQPGTITSR